MQIPLSRYHYTDLSYIRGNLSEMINLGHRYVRSDAPDAPRNPFDSVMPAFVEEACLGNFLCASYEAAAQ
ncbi:hypothetical protein GWI33_015036 [Rhynchophorus ferrugineus]|uniref:Uncharacterized protein n=1 Tax=Rhynchophorus ferrugineus TaxID=354439 RepID=A0A834M6C2_RHYFE|nr:hypothetical protein GWI33_015036 [Rhynchophorus ferrugineus]